MFLLADALSVIIAYLLSLLICFDFSYWDIPGMYISIIGYLLSLAKVTTLAVYYVFRLYHCIWNIASLIAVYRIFGTYFIIAVMLFTENRIEGVNLPKSYMLIGGIADIVGGIVYD
ncbi:hypothetical protein [Butyrivibrio sp. FC2001]|uniref:hypothetical protein n=1 Tax=Butyrivibrio sp. FC2001 TaxID=1280671 RepID=UPI00041FEF6E|nr:hypothetical protein [Butyrivibrio sp. FC2001]